MAIKNLKSKRVLVTGAASGIGLEIALSFARRAAQLIIIDINAGALENAQQELRKLGGQCHTYVADVSDPIIMKELAERVQVEHGPLDVLVNNAGVAFLGSFQCTPIQQWHRTLNINVMGAVHGCQFFLPYMLEAGGARHIVNVASAAGLAPTLNMSAYSASKHAVMGMSDSLSLELMGTRISVSVVCPGIINTPITQVSPSGVGSNIRPDQVTKLGEYYRKNGAHPSVVGEAVVKAVRSGRGLYW
ncbi:putative oxidoreductase EphD [Cupriavidus laharis]|uniref:Oxidoreductase EphD n=1 Tax=Cupriavidus laharis TaxID=151654 RepID=A0ABM8XVP8_9BURK|nr:SDR family NAD(P)-dependent oxidoreductase [Cupriavidus laharis]CAG9184446.1 putative oxidoreductase EphD [Cupriavidus laharis]